MSTTDPEEQPKRRKRRTKKDEPAEVAPASEADTRASDTEATPEAEPPPSAQEEAAEIEPTPADEEAEDAAADVVLEADAEAEDEPASVDVPPADADEAETPDAPAQRTQTRRRRGAQRDPNLPPPVVRAHAKYVRSSARKARLVCDHLRGKSVEEARAILAHTPRAIARDWSKLLESAVANAEHNHELVGEDLRIKAVHADEGPTIKRFRPRAMGRATRIRKRTSHLTILLTPKE